MKVMKFGGTSVADQPALERLIALVRAERQAEAQTDEEMFVLGIVVHAADRTWRTHTLVNATGTWTRPFVPRYPGQETFAGRQLHTVDYRSPEQFRGQHVVVVGDGPGVLSGVYGCLFHPSVPTLRVFGRVFG